MTSVFLVRHASHGLLGRTLVGRAPGVALSIQGRQEAWKLADGLAAGVEVDAVYTSPTLRAVQTAAVIAGRLARLPRPDTAFDEIDFGAWAGKTFDELEYDARWHLWNKRRSAARAPGGESMAEVQSRVWDGMEQLAEQHPMANIVVVSHGDVMKAAILKILGRSLDDWAEVEMSPAHVSHLKFSAGRAEMVWMNCPPSDLNRRLNTGRGGRVAIAE